MRKRRILSLGLLGISILILILFEKHLANKLALLGVIFSLIGAWSILHVMIINRKFSIKRKRLFFYALKTFVKTMISLLIIMTIMFLFFHNSIMHYYGENLKSYSDQSNPLLSMFYRDIVIKFYALPIIALYLWLGLKIIDNRDKELLLLYLTDCQREIHTSLAQFSNDKKYESFESLVMLCLRICKSIPRLSIGRIVNYRPFSFSQPIVSAWLFLPDKEKEEFNIVAVSGPDHYTHELETIKNKFKVSFFKEKEFNELYEKFKRGEKSEDDFELEKVQFISACGYIFKKKQCKSYPDLENCIAFSHGYLVHLTEEQREEIKFKSLLATSVEFRGRTIAVLMLLTSRKKIAFTEVESFALRNVAHFVGNAVGLANSYGVIK